MQHKQDQGTLALLVRVVAKINVRIEQNPGYGMLNMPWWWKLVDTLVLEASVERRVGSSPT